MPFDPLTADDDMTDDDFDIEDGSDDDSLLGSGGEPILMPTQGALAASGSDPLAGVRQGYEAAIKRLRAQRSGLSGTEQLGALLIGYGQPTRRGSWKEGLSNASAMLLKQTLGAKQQDAKREALIAKYLAEMPVQSARVAATTAQAAAATARANKPPKLTEDSDQRMRLGYARRLFPTLTDDDIVKRNLLYSPQIDKQMLRIYGARSAAAAGEEVDPVAEEVVTEAPTLEMFLAKARGANPGVSDDDLTAYYVKKYGGQ